MARHEVPPLLEYYMLELLKRNATGSAGYIPLKDLFGSTLVARSILLLYYVANILECDTLELLREIVFSIRLQYWLPHVRGYCRN